MCPNYEDNKALVQLEVEHPSSGHRRTLNNVLLDTGSQYCIFSQTDLQDLGFDCSSKDIEIIGVDGSSTLASSQYARLKILPDGVPKIIGITISPLHDHLLGLNAIQEGLCEVYFHKDRFEISIEEANV